VFSANAVKEASWSKSSKNARVLAIFLCKRKNNLESEENYVMFVM